MTQVSDERLAEMLEQLVDLKPGPVRMEPADVPDLIAGLVELQSLRSQPKPAGVRVKGLEWSGEYPEQPGLVAYCVGATNPFGGMGWGYRIDYPSDRSSFHATSSGGFDKKFRTMEAAVSACEAHYQQRATHAILSALTEQKGEVNADSPTVVIGYTNWRGEYGEREIVPIQPWFGSTDWHPEPQWLLKAWDVAKDAERDFAIKDIGFASLSNQEPVAAGEHNAAWLQGFEKGQGAKAPGLHNGKVVDTLGHPVSPSASHLVTEEMVERANKAYFSCVSKGGAFCMRAAVEAALFQTQGE